MHFKRGLKMIGFYDYTVWLTYLSLISASAGIMISLSGQGHPYLGVFCLMFCGLCDAFDGMVARTKKNRRDIEKNYGIQIDSLSDLVAFGVLPACIGCALLKNSTILNSISDGHILLLIRAVLYVILGLYILAALIRLAYFNVTEEIRQKTEGDKPRKQYTGLPVTSAALIFPTVLLVDYLCKGIDLGILYFMVAIMTGVAFLLKFKITKPGKRGILIMVAIGIIECLLLVLFRLIIKGVI